jgi:hypothetical protein
MLKEGGCGLDRDFISLPQYRLYAALLAQRKYYQERWKSVGWMKAYH